MPHVAAVALELAAAGRDPRRGTLGPLLVPEPDQVIYADDQPSRLTLLWRDPAGDQRGDRTACYEPQTARQLLGRLAWAQDH